MHPERGTRVAFAVATSYIRRMPRHINGYEEIKLVGPKGTRALYREAAALHGMKLQDWMRETLHANALRTRKKHKIEGDIPPIHPAPPPPLKSK